MSAEEKIRSPRVPDGALGVSSPTNRARLAVTVAAGMFITAYYTLTARALDGFQLHNDLGIQYYLARATADGAVPLVDFEHGWNTLRCYLSAGLYRLVGGNATAWVFLWGRGGFILAGIATLIIAWRARLSARWIAGLTGVWIVLTHVPHNKYAVPAVWAAVLLPADDRVPLSVRRALRVGAAATVFWAHVELAVLLAIGTAMFDVVGRRDGDLRERVLTGLHAPLGVVVGMASQVAVYAMLGLAPSAFLEQAVGAWTVTEFGPLFGYPFLAPFTIRMALLPIALLVPFVPLVWRRLQDPARFLAMCTLALSLIAIRRPGDGHTAAAGTLIAVMLVLAARDLSGRWAEVSDEVMTSVRRPAAIAWVVLGIGWYAVGLQAGFNVSSLIAIVALTMVCLSGALAERMWALPAASVGALLAAVVVLAVGVGTHLTQEVASDDALLETRLIAEAVGPSLQDCTAGERDVWVVPSPLTLYDALPIDNPTPIYAFWYNLGAEHERIIGWMDDGTIPVILQVGAWPESMLPIVGQIEARYEVCVQRTVAATGGLVTVWRALDPAVSTASGDAATTRRD